MNKKILIGSIIAVAILILVSFPTVIGEPEEIENDNLRIYKLAKIKTTDTTGGFAFCAPGFYRSILLNRNIILHSFVAYEWDSWEGWFLTINGNEVPKGRGFIFGFTGSIQNWLLGIPNYSAFDLAGFGMLIIHIPD